MIVVASPRIFGAKIDKITEITAKRIETITSNSTVELYDRRNMAEQVDPDLYVSVHLNSAKNKSLSGTSTFYYTSFSKPLAQCIHNRLVSAYSTSCYQNNPQMMNGLDDGTSFYPFYVTRTESFPSVLIETGYISNDYECAFLTDDAPEAFFLSLRLVVPVVFHIL